MSTPEEQIAQEIEHQANHGEKLPYTLDNDMLNWVRQAHLLLANKNGRRASIAIWGPAGVRHDLQGENATTTLKAIFEADQQAFRENLKTWQNSDVVICILWPDSDVVLPGDAWVLLKPSIWALMPDPRSLRRIYDPVGRWNSEWAEQDWY
jgi:hypothetical protein